MYVRRRWCHDVCSDNFVILPVGSANSTATLPGSLSLSAGSSFTPPAALPVLVNLLVGIAPIELSKAHNDVLAAERENSSLELFPPFPPFVPAEWPLEAPASEVGEETASWKDRERAKECRRLGTELAERWKREKERGEKEGRKEGRKRRRRGVPRREKETGNVLSYILARLLTSDPVTHPPPPPPTSRISLPRYLIKFFSASRPRGPGSCAYDQSNRCRGTILGSLSSSLAAVYRWITD